MLLTRKGRVYVEFFRDTENSRECMLVSSSYNHEAGKNIAFRSDTIVLGDFWLQNKESGDVCHLAAWRLLSTLEGMACNLCMKR